MATGEALAKSVDDRPAVKSRKWWAIPAGVVMLAGIGLGVRFAEVGPTLPAGDEPGAVGSAASATPVVPVPPDSGKDPVDSFFPCDEQDAGGWKRCEKTAKAWCDRKGQVVGCCASPLVPVSREGFCACPPGGVTEKQDAGSSGCTPATPDDKGKAIQTVVRSHSDDLRKCYEDALRINPKATGRFSVYFEIDPQGQVHRATIRYVSLPDPKFQACALGFFRSMRFPPPRGGAQTVVYPIRMSPDEPW